MIDTKEEVKETVKEEAKEEVKEASPVVNTETVDALQQSFDSLLA